MAVTTSPSLRTSAHKSIFCLDSDRGNSNKLGWKLQGFLTLEPHESWCQEERCEHCLLILLCHGLRQGGGKHWEAGNQRKSLRDVTAMELIAISAFLPLILSGNNEHLHLYSKL